MKQYRVSRVTVVEPYGSSTSTLTTCIREFNTKEEALSCVYSMKDRFPNAFIAESGNLVREIEYVQHKYFKNIGVTVDIVRRGSVFWMILEHGDGDLPMPISLN